MSGAPRPRGFEGRGDEYDLDRTDSMSDLRRGVGSVGSCWSHQGHRVAGSTLGSRKTRIYARKFPVYGTKEDKAHRNRGSGPQW